MKALEDIPISRTATEVMSPAGYVGRSNGLKVFWSAVQDNKHHLANDEERTRTREAHRQRSILQIDDNMK